MFDAVCVFEEPEPGGDFRLVHRAAFGRPGRLVYVVGPSGSGKDSVLAWVRASMPRGAAVAFAKRTITRAADAGGEAHIAVTPEEFEAQRARGEFAMHWGANGNRYGIGQEIHDWLSAGMTVVVSGSREHLPEALAKFPRMEVAHITASAEVLRRRLARRGRESAMEISQRLARAREFALPAGVRGFEVDNDGDIAVAGRALLDHLLEAAHRNAGATGEVPPDQTGGVAQVPGVVMR